MSKKIGIITQPLITNYGGILQNFALQKVLVNNGFKVVTLNRERHSSNMRIFLSAMKQSIIRGRFISPVFNGEKLLFRKNANEFIDKYINKVTILNPTNSKLENEVKHQKIDILIVGSDQVWRPEYAINIYNEFLDFEKSNKVKKIAYAASFGFEKWMFSKEEELKCKLLLNDFNAVSVRENLGKVFCDKYFDRNAKVVLDPTMLLSKEDYLYVIQKCKGEIDVINGIFTYILDNNSFKTEVINSISDLAKLSVFNSSSRLDNVTTNRSYPAVEKWLSGFHNCEYIVTDSFHGTVFSIIFNKPFFVLLNKERGADRFLTLLKKFNLENRIVNSLDAINELLSDEIDWDSVNEQLEESKKESLEFLLSNIK